ncbi:MAG: hypothetical protein MNPFHGCM_02438 [Gemmatimonadaceae bacterium]|nr:hypothetical protein [Gemmatimonadaceae bacterium]
MFEAAPVDDLGGQHQDGMERDAAKALQPLDHGGKGRREGELFDRPIEVVAALQFIHEQRMLLSEDEPIVRGQGGALGGAMQEPPQMRGTPVRALAKDEAPAGEELKDG